MFVMYNNLPKGFRIDVCWPKNKYYDYYNKYQYTS